LTGRERGEDQILFKKNNTLRVSESGDVGKIILKARIKQREEK